MSLLVFYSVIPKYESPSGRITKNSNRNSRSNAYSVDYGVIFCFFLDSPIGNYSFGSKNEKFSSKFQRVEALIGRSEDYKAFVGDFVENTAIY